MLCFSSDSVASAGVLRSFPSVWMSYLKKRGPKREGSEDGMNRNLGVYLHGQTEGTGDV